MTAGTLMGMRPEVSSLIAACYNKGCAPPPVGKGGSNKGEATRAARLRSVQARGAAVKAVKSRSRGARAKLAAARKRVDATRHVNRRETTKNRYEVDAQGKRIRVDRATKISRQKLISGKETSKNDIARLRAANMLGPGFGK